MRWRTVAVFSCAAVMAAACTGSDNATSPDEPSASTTAMNSDDVTSDGVDGAVTFGEPTEVVDGPVGDGETFSRAIDDISVTIPSSSVDGTGTVTVSRRPVATAELPDGVDVISDGIDVRLTSEVALTGNAQVTFMLPPDFETETGYPVVFWQGRDGTVRLLPAEWMPGDETVTATVDHFSGGFLGRIDIVGTARTWAGNAADYFTGRSGVSQPSCGDEDAARRGGLTVTSDGGDTVKWCFGIEDGQRILRVANNRRAYAEVAFPDSWEVLDSGRFGLSVDAVNRLFSDGAAELVVGSGRDVQILSGGETVTFAVPDGEVGNVRVEMSVTAWLLSAVVFGADVYSGVAKLIAPGLGDVASGSWNRMASQLESGQNLGAWVDAARDCVRSLTDQITDKPLSVDVAVPLMKFVWGCVPAMMAAEISESGYSLFLLGTVLAAIGTAVGLVLSVANLIITAVREVFDSIVSFAGDDDVIYDIVIGVDLPGVFRPRPGDRPQLSGGPVVMLVLDTSGSMAEQDSIGRIKIEAARASVLDFLAGVETTTQLGLRTYPSGSGGGCNAGRERFPLGGRDPAGTSAIVRTLVPEGDTPTAEALVASAQALDAAGALSGTIILVSDGESTCADPCAAAGSIEAAGIAIQVHTVALAASDAARQELDCIAGATGGLSADAGDTDELQEILDDLSRPELTVSLDYPAQVVAEVGAGAGTAEITATVTNASQLIARDVRVRIRFLDGVAAVTAPSRALGNIDVASSSTAVWQFRPGITLAGTIVRFEVVVTGDNLNSDPTASGSIAVEDELLREDAGAILADADRVVILGDSFSSGEGAGAYLAGTDTPENACHRSTSTYLVDAFDIPGDAILACSGAVAAHLTGPGDNGQDPQLTQLDRWQNDNGAADAVVLTIGGNDIGFESIAISCLFSPISCTERIYNHETDAFLDSRMAALAETLWLTYGRIDQVLNRPDQVANRGGRRAPIIALAYPRLLPGAKIQTLSRPCIALTTFTQDELDLGAELITRLNGEIELATKVARGQGVPVLFVPTVEDAFLPDHTICDGNDAYVRSPETIALSPGGQDLAAYLATLGPDVNPLGSSTAGVAVDDFGRRIQELFHPNEDGYLAMGQAVLRWSLTDEANEPLPEASDPDPGSIDVDGTANPLGQLDPNAPRPTLQGGGTYQLQVDGFAPGSPVDVTAQSWLQVLASTIADADGVVDGNITIPGDLEPGNHVLTVSGFGSDGAGRSVEIEFSIPTGRSFPWHAGGTGVAILLLLAGALLRRRQQGTVDNAA